MGGDINWEGNRRVRTAQLRGGREEIREFRQQEFDVRCCRLQIGDLCGCDNSPGAQRGVKAGQSLFGCGHQCC